MPPKQPRRSVLGAEKLAPIIKPLIAPAVRPVLTRLDRHEALLHELKAALDVQFKRTADIQAQLDQLLGRLGKLDL